MIYQEFLPALPLRGLIHSYAILENTDEFNYLKSEFTPPNLGKGLMFYYQRDGDIFIKNGVYDNILPMGFVLPHATKKHHWNYSKRFGTFAVIFNPGKFRSFFPIPIFGYLNSCLSFEDWNRKDILELHEKIYEAQNHKSRVEITDQYFLKLLAKSMLVNDAIDWALTKFIFKPEIKVRKNISDIRISERHFRRTFEREMGIQPKQYLKILRFTKALHYLNLKQFQKINDVAYQCGFYDHSAFVRQFKNYTGYTPNQYLKSQSDISNAIYWRDEVIDEKRIITNI